MVEHCTQEHALKMIAAGSSAEKLDHQHRIFVVCSREEKMALNAMNIIRSMPDHQIHP